MANRPKDSGTPGKGKHGVPDKQAAKVGKKWEQSDGRRAPDQPARHKK